MTKFESLIKCRNHWQWLAITGSEDKRSYAPSLEWTACCACCEYTEQTTKQKGCEGFCGLMGYAWEPCDWDVPCLRPHSLYKQWYWSIDKKLAAQKMVDACNRAIEDMIIGGSYE